MDPRRFHNLVAIGQVEEVDAERRHARVRIGELLTDFLPVPAFYGHNFTVAAPIRIGAQAVIFSPSGDLENGLIVAYAFSDDHPPYTTDKDVLGVKFSDGTTVQYHHKDQILDVISKGTVNVKSVGHMLIESDANITVKAAGTLALEGSQITMTGPVTQTGGDLTSDGTSLQTHKHPETGTVTQAPQ